MVKINDQITDDYLLSHQCCNRVDPQHTSVYHSYTHAHFFWHGLDLLVLLEGRVTAIQYKVAVSDTRH